MQTILFTGGGTAGHVTPNLALIQKCQQEGWEVIYAGSKKGLEREIIQRINIPYHCIATGKFRRYFSWRTFIEPFAVLLGILQAFYLCRKHKPRVIFSKGGFVAFPVVVGGWLNRIPVVIHESDLTPGLANRLSFPFAKTICITFPEGKQHISSVKVIVTGTPIRDALLQGQSDKGRTFCGFNSLDPVLLILGGGQGSAIINETIYSIMPELLKRFQIAHICGKGKTSRHFSDEPRYKQFEYLNDELADLFACADIVVSRAGANALYELLFLKKPHVLIPLSRRASRGDQIVNAQYFAHRGLSKVLLEEDMNKSTLLAAIDSVYSEKNAYKQRLLEFHLPDSNQLIYGELLKMCHK